MIFETHAHYDDDRFSEDRDAIIASLPLHNIERVINVGASIEMTYNSVNLAEKYDYVYAAAGVHPSEVNDLDREGINWLKDVAVHEKVVAIGEIGLDYYWEKEETVRENQRRWFREQMDVAVEMKLPVIIHSRDAAEDTLNILKEYANTGIEGVVHCYSYSPEIAIELIKLGYYIGVGGVVTFKNSKKLKETVVNIPIEKLLLETDCPYMAPEPYRGKRNDSTLIPYVVKEIAQLRGMSEDEVMRVTRENAYRLFSKVK
jgi:TatD DNase family protein